MTISTEYRLSHVIVTALYQWNILELDENLQIIEFL